MITRNPFFSLTSVNLMTGPSAAPTDTTASSAATIATRNARRICPPLIRGSEVDGEPGRPHRAIVGGQEPAVKPTDAETRHGRGGAAGRVYVCVTVAKVQHRIAIVAMHPGVLAHPELGAGPGVVA